MARERRPHRLQNDGSFAPGTAGGVPTFIVYSAGARGQALAGRRPVIEQALETAALRLGSDRSRGYCLEMICGDFLAGANLDNQNPETLLFSTTRFFRFLPHQHQQAFLQEMLPTAS